MSFVSKQQRINRNRLVNPAGAQRPQVQEARLRRSAQAEATGSLRIGNGIARDNNGRTALDLSRATLTVDNDQSLDLFGVATGTTRLVLKVRGVTYG
jgi:hypothetical protein